MSNSSNLEFKKRFDSIAENYEKILNQYSVKRRIESLTISTNGLFLEVGAGTGLIGSNLQSKIICTDISYNMCKQIKKRNLAVICCDAENLPFKESIFDAIISAEMIYLLKNPQKFISYSYKILKKGGKLLIFMPTEKMIVIDKLRTILRKLGAKRAYFDDGNKKFMKLSKLEHLLKKYNFTINTIEKKIIFPFESFDKINRVLEKTFLNYFGIFVLVKATSSNQNID